MLFEVAVTS